MSKNENENFKKNKNFLADSSVNAGKNVHIGDIVNNIYSGEKEEVSTGKAKIGKEKKVGSKLLESTFFKVVLFSVTLLAITISVQKCEFTGIDNSVNVGTDIEKPQDSEIKEPLPKTPDTSNKGKEITTEVPNNKKKPSEPKSKTESKPKLPPPEKKVVAPKIFNEKFSGNLAIVNLGSQNAIANKLKNHLKKENHQSSTSFFRSSFLAQYRSSVWQQGSEIMEEISLPNNLKCVCLVEEQFETEVRQRGGHPFTVIDGKVEIKILNLETGESIPISIPVGGSGADESAAYLSFQENFMLKFIDQNILQQFTSCKN